MNHKIKRKLVNDLRFGGHVKGTGCFEKAGYYCVLGRLCVVAGIPVRDAQGADNYPGVYAHISKDQCDELWKMNDLRDWSFPQIADWIEENL